MVSAWRSSSQLKSEYQGVANFRISAWSSSDEDEAAWYLHDQVSSDCSLARIKFYKSRNVADFVWHVSFTRSATNTWRRSLEPQTVPKVDRLWKRSVLFMREVQVYHEVPVSCPDKSGLNAIRTQWVYTNEFGASNPFIRARLVAQETKRVSELTPEDASSTFAATPPLESPKVMLSGCMTGKRRALAQEKVLGFSDISGAHFRSLAHRTIVIKVPREDDECTSGYAVLDEAMYGAKDAAQCFDVASEKGHDSDGLRHGKFSPYLYRSSAVDTSSSNLPHWDHAQRWGDVKEVRILNRIVRWVKPPY